MTAPITLLGIAAAILVAPAHADDPAPEPPTPYQIAGPDGPRLPGSQILPPICGVYMRGCGFTYSPDTGTWQPSVTDR
jgi:hypothetical protein